MRLAVAGVTALLALLASGCATVSLPTSMVGATTLASNRAAITVPGILPAPPARAWLKDDVDVNEHRADGWGLVAMPEMEAYLNSLLQKIKVATGTQTWPGKVHITAESALTASSSAAGNIYISLGWLQSAESEDEVFAILSHEYGHIYLNHHSAYAVGNLGDTSLLLASIGWSYANRKAADTGWNGVDKIQMVQLVGSTVLMPAWERSLEEQADMFGTTVSLKCGYSYIHGFKAFLERIDSYDRSARQEDEALQQEQARLARDLVKKQTLARIASTSAAASTNVSPSVQPDQTQSLLSGLNNALTQLNAALVEGQVKLDQGTFDAGRSINVTIQTTLTQLRETHPDGALREDFLSKQFTDSIKRNRPPVRVREWESAKKRGQTAEILSHYGTAWKAIEILKRGDRQSGLKMAARAASGATANDATMVEPLAIAIDDTHSTRQGKAIDVLLRNLRSSERSWRVQLDIADRLSLTDPARARTFLDQQFQYFGKAPKLWPDVIAFYQKTGNTQEGKQMALACAAASPDYRNACMTASQSPAEMAQIKAKTDAHTSIVVEQVKKRWIK